MEGYGREKGNDKRKGKRTVDRERGKNAVKNGLG